ncbi:putative multidrug resistance protein [Tanacetum coccineum]|uniref:Multidrug resistance protein n=1 Tax=Tanacetum coccineum TaxID=301880 RepID=A0ABQ5IUP0_9ASTR
MSKSITTTEEAETLKEDDKMPLIELSLATIPFPGYLKENGLGKLASTKLIIELADKTVKRPKGIAENVLVGINKYIFPVDFIILDMPEDIKIPLILGRPFLSTTNAKIDAFKRKIALKIRNDKIVFKSDSPTSNIINKVYVLRLREQIELDLEARIMSGPVFEDFIKLNDLNEPLELNDHEMEDLDPKIEDGEIIDELKVDVVKIRHDDEIVEKIDEYLNFAIVENMDVYRDKDMGDVIVGKPFCRVACVESKWFDGFITIHDANDSVTYQIARSHPRKFALISKAKMFLQRNLEFVTRIHKGQEDG